MRHNSVSFQYIYPETRETSTGAYLYLEASLTATKSALVYRKIYINYCFNLNTNHFVGNKTNVTRINITKRNVLFNPVTKRFNEKPNVI